MIPSQTFENYPVFGDNATKVKPDDVKYAAGFQQADVLPAEWMNWAWNKNSKGITELQAGTRSLEAEINSVLTAASITPDVSENAQLTAAINYLISTGNSATTTKLKTARTIGLTDADGTNTGTSISFDGSADKTLKLPSTIKASLSGTATNATCFAGCTYAQAKADIRSGLTGCTGTVTSIKLYCGTTCKGEITSSGSICLGANAFNSTAFTTCTGTVTSIKFQCAGTDKCTITGSGTINLSANAWNTNATISTTTYPGACCTGTLTPNSGCAYDSARLGGTAASGYLKTTGCAADSAKLGGSSLASVRYGYWSCTAYGKACLYKNSLTHQWVVNHGATLPLQCDVAKAIWDAFGGSAACVPEWVGVLGFACVEIIKMGKSTETFFLRSANNYTQLDIYFTCAAAVSTKFYIEGVAPGA